MLRKVDCIYLSGILDGEGCLTVGAGKRNTSVINYNPIIAVQNTSKQLIDWLQTTFGGQVYLSKKETKKTRAAWMWRITKKNHIEKVLLATLPYLIIKREQALLLTKFVRLERTAPTSERIVIYEELRRLNARGKSVTTNMQNTPNLPNCVVKPYPVAFHENLRKGRVKIEPELHGDMQSDPTVTLED